ncbi:pyridoxal-dependent decarboxylase [Chryseobacterium capnotolerans]|uniref:pyridoxal-dependent decarboxylase n=1 Tax=Chryseobacterium capnotolerans TaxID=2759528 RepID=UPI003211AFAF
MDIIKKQSTEYLNSLADRPTSITSTFISEAIDIPEYGYGTEEVIKLFNKRFEPIMVGSAGPRYLGFVTGGATPASVAGDWLTSIYDQNTQSTKGQGDISANVEMETIKLILELLELPDSFLGGFVTGATMSNFTCLAVARQWLGKEKGRDFAKEGISETIKVLTATPHSSSIKSLSLLGMGSNNIIKIRTDGDDREAISIKDLEEQIIKLNGEPFILISSGGTVNTVDFDDFIQIKS